MAGVKSGLALLGGAGVGAALMYLLDPEAGAARRRYLAELAEDAASKAGDSVHAATSAVKEAGESLKHRGVDAGGKLHDTWEKLSGQARKVGASLYHQAQSAADRADIHALTDKLVEHARNIGSSVSQHASHVSQQASDAVAGHADDIKGAYQSAVSKARQAIGSESETSHGAAASTILGLSAAGVAALAAAGAGAYYLLDPEQGPTRRQELGEKAVSAVSSAGAVCREAGAYLRQEANYLADHVRDLLDRGAERSHEISDSGNEPGMEPEAPTLEWSTTTRVVVGVAGGALGFYGITRRNVLGIGAGLAGIGLLVASITQPDLEPVNSALRQANEAAHNVTDRARHYAGAATNAAHGAASRAVETARQAANTGWTAADQRIGDAAEKAKDVIRKATGGDAAGNGKSAE